MTSVNDRWERARAKRIRKAETKQPSRYSLWNVKPVADRQRHYWYRYRGPQWV